jgi:hypothetical protein
MANESPLSLDDLALYRQRLNDFCALHYRSLVKFQDGISFKLNPEEPKLGPTARHLSSSATCIESLLECPAHFQPTTDSPNLSQLASDFANSALRRPQDKWFSDESARIYCRCRTLPIAIYHLPRYTSEIEKHLKCILYQLVHDPSRMAIGEASKPYSEQDSGPDNWYRPNAFHTYWTLYLLRSLEERFPLKFRQLIARFKKTRLNVERLRQEMLMWAQRTAGYQIALHTQDSVKLDSDQLAWSLTILLKFGRDFQTDLGQQDFVRCALKCLFERQTSAGIWRTGSPLFHYRRSGNAYCYVFETFSTLFGSVLTERKEGVFLRRELLLYVRKLLRLWDYACATQIPLSPDGTAVGWSSGHRVNHTEPESWATASVFSFSQGLRRLVGIWARELAAAQLRVVVSHGSKQTALLNISNRGETWTAEGKSTAATQLMTLFVNPSQLFRMGRDLDPDSQPIAADQARAAILFGPPGTSKTTLARSLADAIGWDYVELHASHFVAEGLPNVQRTANTIFDRLTQLDRTVILFDEIDELVRAREKEPDAFGRFLTTSMLPKLAELWKCRKVMYFVATNHIRFFDPAVTRAQRFDALVHVSPPSFKKKIEHIVLLLEEQSIKVKKIRLSQQDVERCLAAAAHHNIAQKHLDNEATQRTPVELPPSCLLAKFLLLRWDQLRELSSAIKSCRTGESSITLTRALMNEALSMVTDPSFSSCAPFDDFVESRKYEGHDFSKCSVWQIQGTIPRAACKSQLTFRDGRYWYANKVDCGDRGSLLCHNREIRPGILKLS